MEPLPSAAQNPRKSWLSSPFQRISIIPANDQRPISPIVHSQKQPPPPATSPRHRELPGKRQVPLSIPTNLPSSQFPANRLSSHPRQKRLADAAERTLGSSLYCAVPETARIGARW